MFYETTSFQQPSENKQRREVRSQKPGIREPVRMRPEAQGAEKYLAASSEFSSVFPHLVP